MIKWVFDKKKETIGTAYEKHIYHSQLQQFKTSFLKEIYLAELSNLTIFISS